MFPLFHHTLVGTLWQRYPGWSPYVYAADNPLKYIDPDGEKLVRVNTGRQTVLIDEVAASSLGEVARLANEQGIPFVLVSHFRTMPDQQIQYEKGWGVPPGTSYHEAGMAIDVRFNIGVFKSKPELKEQLIKLLTEKGFTQSTKKGHETHFTYQWRLSEKYGKAELIDIIIENQLQIQGVLGLEDGVNDILGDMTDDWQRRWEEVYSPENQ